MASVCKLCDQKSELVNSHILSHFLYQPIYREKSQYYLLSDNPNVEIEKGQGGIKEKILCEKCEARRSGWERYTREMMFGNAQPALNHIYDILYKAEGLNYHKLKLFVLSTLWICAVSTRPYFSEIILGQYEERIRKMLLENDPGPEEQYGFYLQRITDEWGEGIILMNRIVIEDIDCYRFMAGSWIWTIFLSEGNLTDITKDLIVHENGEALVGVSAARDNEWVVEFARRANSQGKLTLT